MTTEASVAPDPVEELLKARIAAYTEADAVAALENAGEFDRAVGIQVAPIEEEVVDGITIRDSAARVAPDVQVGAHVHFGGDVDKERPLRGLEVYKILGGEGLMFLGYPNGKQDPEGRLLIDWDEPIPVSTGSFIPVRPGQAHSLYNPGKRDLVFVFSGSPDHIVPKESPPDRKMAVTPAKPSRQI